MASAPKTYGDVDGLITMLTAACKDLGMNETLQSLLSQPNEKRRRVVKELLLRFHSRGAPKPLIEAFACLLDDEVAEKVYVHIFKCAKGAEGAR